MTTTSTFTGLGDDTKPTSRVLKPPGGGSSNIFGGPEPAPAPKARATPSKKQDSGIFSAAPSDGSDGKRSARDGDDSFSHLFGDPASTPNPQQKGTSAASQRADTHANLFGASNPPTTPSARGSGHRPDTYANLFGEPPAQQQGAEASSQKGDTYANIFGSIEPPVRNLEGSKASQGNTHDNLFGGVPGQSEVTTSTHSHSRYTGKGRGAYNPITGADYKDLASNHHALHVKEPPKPQKEQPPLPCSDGEYQAKGGKMQNVQTSTRISNPPGGKTHKLW